MSCVLVPNMLAFVLPDYCGSRYFGYGVINDGNRKTFVVWNREAAINRSIHFVLFHISAIELLKKPLLFLVEAIAYLIINAFV